MIEVITDPSVALNAAATAAQAKASADYAALLTTVNIAIQAIVTIVLALLAYWQVVVPIKRSSSAIVEQGHTMLALEKNTNSIKDALVKQEGVLGEERGRLQEQGRQAAAAAAAAKDKPKENG